MNETCTFCGDDSIGPCPRKHLETIIVLPSEIKPGDIWKRRTDAKSYPVAKIWYDPAIDGYRLLTTTKKKFHIFYPELPELVRRLVQCGYPRCDLHCGKCMLYVDADERQAKIRGEDPDASADRERQKKAKRKKEAKKEGVSKPRRL